MERPHKHDPLDVALFEPWYGGSHRAFADVFRDRSAHRVTVHGLKPRHWRWRQEASAWELARAVQGLGAPDALVVTDYVDLARLIGFLPSAWRSLPVVAYFHENQLTYPAGPEAPEGSAASGPPIDHHAGFSNVLTALRADALVFNSAFHRDDFARAADSLLRTLPRPNPRRELEGAIERAHVVPPLPDLAAVPLGRGAPEDAPLRVLFPHRLEHDKDPVAFLSALAEAATARPIEAVLTGGDPTRARPDVRSALDAARAHVVHAGHIEERSEYLALIGTCDVVASTAKHEFFGVAVLEAMAAGAAPLLPGRLAYPELLGTGPALPPGFGIVRDLGPSLSATRAEDARDPGTRAAVRRHALAHDAAGPRGVCALDEVVGCVGS